MIAQSTIPPPPTKMNIPPTLAKHPEKAKILQQCAIPQEIQSKFQISRERLQTDNRQPQPLHHAHLAMATTRTSPTIPISLSTKPQPNLGVPRFDKVQFLISLGTTFQLKLTILIFWTKFVQRKHFWSKTKKVNSIIEFCIFELDQLRDLALN